MIKLKKILNNFVESNIGIFFILFAFLYPTGFETISSVYKNFFKLYLFVALLIIFLYAISNMTEVIEKIKMGDFIIYTYFIVFLAITFFIQGTISEGFKKMIATPVLILYLNFILEKKSKILLYNLAYILSILMALRLILFNGFFISQFNPDGLVTFLGHVQAAAQIGLLAILISYILYSIFQDRKLSILLVILSCLTMFFSDTAASKICLILLFIIYIMYKTDKIFLINIPSKILIAFYFIGNLLLYVFAFLLGNSFIIGGINLSLNSRTLIWQEVIKMLKSRFLLGYGAYGVYIYMFWSTATDKMNYAHNELLQRMLDGGIILSFLFVILVYYLIKNIDDLSKGTFKGILISIILIYFLIMFTESVTEYYYMFIFMLIIKNINNILNVRNEGGVVVE